jgi:tRNA A37 threonylcarbamoyladenosine modification protein TsaB
MMKVLLTIAFVFFATAVSAEDLELLSVKSLKCTFNGGYSASSKNGKYNAEEDKNFNDLIFDSINLKKGEARVIGNQGAGDIAVIVTGTGITFIEQTTFGNLAFTTVFHERPKGFEDFAVIHSRHMDIIGVIMPSQYYGTCKKWD